MAASAAELPPGLAFGHDWCRPPEIIGNLPRGLTEPLRRSLGLFAGPERFITSLPSRLGGGHEKLRSLERALYAGAVLLDSFVFAFVLAALYGSLLAALGRGPRGVRASVRRYWRPLFAWGLSLGAISLLVVLAYPMPAYRSDGYGSAWVAREALMTWLRLPFTLAPFVIVAQGVGFRTGVVRGLRLIGRWWPTLIGLVVLYRIGYALLTFVNFPLGALRDNLWWPFLDAPVLTPRVLTGEVVGLVLLTLQFLARAWLELSLSTAYLALALPEQPVEPVNAPDLVSGDATPPGPAEAP